MRKTKILLALSFLLMAFGSTADNCLARETTDAAVAHMPVKEVTIFKDGHAVVNQEGKMPVDESGNVILDTLPSPVMGTFFPYSADSTSKLVAVTAGRRKIKSSRTALALAELIAANPGAQVRIDELSGSGQNSKVISYDAQILGIPTRSAEELASDTPGERAELILPQKSSLVALKTAEGKSFVPLERIQTITFKGEHKDLDSQEELKNVLTLKLAAGAQKKAKADVGMMYLQSGLRWIPSYKVTIDGSNHAHIKLQATIVNDLIDLDDVNTNLVVGVPSFAFKDQTDPISLSQTLSMVAAQSSRDSYLRNAFSNGVLSQSLDARMTESSGTPVVEGSGNKSEDLFVFNIKHLTVKKGERIVLPVREYEVTYKDLYTLDVPVLPPAEVQYTGQQNDSASDPDNESLKVMHKIRLDNTAKEPLTTAPALVFISDGGRDEILSQGMMTYAAPGTTCDLTLTQAIDIKAQKQEQEVSRQPDAVNLQDHRYARINMKGTIKLANFGSKTASLEITRKIMGKADTVDKGGKIVALSPLEQGKPLYPTYYNWPAWWTQLNSYNQFVFKQELEPKQKLEFSYDWHYFWRY